MKKINLLSLLLLSLCFIVFIKCTSKNESKKIDSNVVMKKEELQLDTSFTDNDMKFIKHCLNLAEEALEAGDEPFGSILVDKNNEILAEARNRVNEKNVLAHPELELVQWAMENLTLEERKETVMYTTGEHCPMCSGAHGLAELGGLKYLGSSEQLVEWLDEFEVSDAPIEFIPAKDIIKNGLISGPIPGEMLDKIKEMHKRYHLK